MSVFHVFILEQIQLETYQQDFQLLRGAFCISSPIGSSTPLIFLSCSLFNFLFSFLLTLINIDAHSQLVGNNSGNPERFGSMRQLWEMGEVSNFLRLL